MKRRMRSLVLVALVGVILAGCAHTGRFARERQFHVETVEFRPDGTFVFTCWFDDGGATREVVGTWRSGEVKDTAVSTIPGLAPDERTDCVHLSGQEIWEFRLDGWHRGLEGPYKRLRR